MSDAPLCVSKDHVHTVVCCAVLDALDCRSCWTTWRATRLERACCCVDDVDLATRAREDALPISSEAELLIERLSSLLDHERQDVVRRTAHSSIYMLLLHAYARTAPAIVCTRRMPLSPPAAAALDVDARSAHTLSPPSESAVTSSRRCAFAIAVKNVPLVITCDTVDVARSALRTQQQQKRELQRKHSAYQAYRGMLLTSQCGASRGHSSLLR